VSAGVAKATTDELQAMPGGMTDPKLLCRGGLTLMPRD
jgi:hypothetical protein